MVANLLALEELHAALAARFPGRYADTRPTRGERVRRGAHLRREVERMLSRARPRTAAAQSLFTSHIGEVAFTEEVMGIGHELGWPKDTARVAFTSLLDDALREARQSWRASVEATPGNTRVPIELRRLATLPLRRLDLANLRLLLDVVAVTGFPCDVADPAVRLPQFVKDLRDALLAAGCPREHLDEKLLEVRRWVAAERHRHLDAVDLAQNVARRLAELEREEQCTIPPRLRDLWLYHAAEARSRGVEFEDPLDGCFRNAVAGAPEPTVAVDRYERVLLFATLCGEPNAIGITDTRGWHPDDLSFALDLGRPIERDQYVDFPVLVIAGGDGMSWFVCEAAAASDDWLR